MPKARDVNTVQPGDAFSVRLKDGRFGFCRVLSISEMGPVIAAADLIDSQPPKIPDVGRPPILMLNSFQWRNEPCISIVMGPRPASFERIGVIEPTRSEASVQCEELTRWDVIAMHILNEWRWKHDRDALVAEVRAQQQAEREEIERQEVEELHSLSYERLRKAPLFDSWKDTIPKHIITVSRAIVWETIDSLAGLSKAAPEEKKIEILHRFVDSFNRLDAKNNHFIETVEREDIVDIFRKLVRLCGLQGREDLADQWREW